MIRVNENEAVTDTYVDYNPLTCTSIIFDALPLLRMKHFAFRAKLENQKMSILMKSILMNNTPFFNS
jgi:hypothetical protein